MRKPIVLAGVLLFSWIAGCDDKEDTGDASVDAVKTTPLYHEDIEPILLKNCMGCHIKGGIGPFELVEYEQVKALGDTILDAVNSRRMPPFLPDNSGDCATYQDAMWLTDDELAAINAWVEGDMPEGDPEAAPEGLSAPPSLAEDKTHEAWMPIEYTPNADVSDDYRCFLFESDIESDQPLYIEEYEVVPGETRVVHHVVVYQPASEADLQAARELDEAESGPGYTCFGGSGVSARMLMNWAPGTPIVKHPEGTGVTVEPGLPFLVQMHYNLANGALPDQTRLRMKMAEEVEHPVTPWFLGNLNLELPPKQEEVVSDQDRPFAGTFQAINGHPPPPMTIVGVRAHMHGLGTEMVVERTDGETGEVSCLVDIPRYDFNWQRSYFLNQAVPLNPSDSLRVRCVYNTMGRDETVYWGDGTSDEMCLATFYTYDNGPIPEGPETPEAVADPSCPPYTGEFSGMMLDLPGCCTPEGVCGVISSLNNACITESTILTDLEPGGACEPPMLDDADADADDDADADAGM